jgi:hypothetical protein
VRAWRAGPCGRGRGHSKFDVALGETSGKPQHVTGTADEIKDEHRFGVADVFAMEAQCTQGIAHHFRALLLSHRRRKVEHEICGSHVLWTHADPSSPYAWGKASTTLVVL